MLFKLYINSLIKNKHAVTLFPKTLLFQIGANFFLSAVLLLLLIVSERQFSESEILSFVVLGFFCIGEISILVKTLEKHFNERYLNHLRKYRLNRKEIFLLSLLQVLPTCLSAIITVLLLMAYMQLEVNTWVALLIFFSLIFVTEVLFFTITLKRKHGTRKKLLRQNIQNGFFWKNENLAYLSRDVKILTKSQILLDLPLTILISFVLYFSYLVFSQNDISIYLFLLFSYLSYSFAVFALLSVSADLQNQPIARLHLNQYGLLPGRLQRIFFWRVVLGGVLLAFCHIIALLAFGLPPLVFLLDAIALCFVLVSLTFISSFYVWLIANKSSINPIVEFAAFLFSITVLPSIITGIICHTSLSRGRRRFVNS